MLTPDAILKRASRKYRDVLRAWLSGEEFAPIDYPVGALSNNLTERRHQIEVLRDKSSEVVGTGYALLWDTVNTQALGKQTIPRRVLISTLDDYLELLRRRTEFSNFVADVHKIRKKFPFLEAWMQSRPQDVIEHQGKWDDLLLVCEYFVEHPNPKVYIRELQIAVHTKFIEKHTSILRDLLDILLPDTAINSEASDFIPRFGLRDKPSLLRMRLLDEQLDRQYTIIIDDISLPVDQLAHLLSKHIQPRHIIIVENLVNFLTVPSHPGTVALFGGGFAVHLLKDVAWLNQCDILYWGDIDAHGFQILSDFRSIFSRTRSVLMDTDTLEENIQFAVQDNQGRAERFTNLNEDERILLDYIWDYQLRLEQEHIPHQYAVGKIKRLLLGNS